MPESRVQRPGTSIGIFPLPLSFFALYGVGGWSVSVVDFWLRELPATHTHTHTLHLYFAGVHMCIFLSSFLFHLYFLQFTNYFYALSSLGQNRRVGPLPSPRSPLYSVSLVYKTTTAKNTGKESLMPELPCILIKNSSKFALCLLREFPPVSPLFLSFLFCCFISFLDLSVLWFFFWPQLLLLLLLLPTNQ